MSDETDKLTPEDKIVTWGCAAFVFCGSIIGLLAISCEVENNQLKHQQEMLRIQLQFATTNRVQTP